MGHNESLRDAVSMVLRAASGLPRRLPVASACSAGANVTPWAGEVRVGGKLLASPMACRPLPLRDGRRSLGS